MATLEPRLLRLEGMISRLGDDYATQMRRQENFEDLVMKKLDKCNEVMMLLAMEKGTGGSKKKSDSVNSLM